MTADYEAHLMTLTDEELQEERRKVQARIDQIKAKRRELLIRLEFGEF